MTQFTELNTAFISSIVIFRNLMQPPHTISQWYQGKHKHRILEKAGRVSHIVVPSPFELEASHVQLLYWAPLSLPVPLARAAAAWSSRTPLGLELRFLSESSEEFLVSSALPATPWSLGLLEVEPVWAPDWRSGSGDWRPWLGADIFVIRGV